jgi:MFS family permease
MMTVFKIRSIYLLMYMGFAIWRVYYNVYLENIGLKGAEIGTLNAIMQATILFVITIWGIIADKKGIRPTLRIATIITAISIFYLGEFTSFWILLIYIPLITLFYHPLGPLTDALAVQYSVTEKKHSFGSLRLWGSLGWALASILGALAFKFKLIEVDYIFELSALMFILLIFFLTTRKRKHIFRPNFEALPLREILKNKPLLLFLGIIILYGFTCSPINSYYNLYFVDLGFGNDIIGIAYAIMAFSEVPLFIVGDRISKRFGAQTVIVIAMITMLIRFVIYGLLPNVYLALAVGALQGISLAFFLVGAVAFIPKLMPQGRYATAQSFIWGGYIGIGQMIGNLFIGFLLDNTGMIGVMNIFIWVALICLLFSLLYFRNVAISNNRD